MFGFRTPKLDSLSCDTTGWRIGQESSSNRIWVTPEKVCVNFQFNSSAPDFPFDLTDQECAKTYYDTQSAELGGAMISVDVAETSGLEYVRGVFKYRSPEPGSRAMYFVGIVVLPFKTFSYQINIEAVEVGVTGMREAAVMALGDGPSESNETPQIFENMDDFFAKSRAVKLRRIPADDTRYDEMFSEHPLTQVRRLQSHVIGTLTFPDWFSAKPKFRISR